MKKFKVLLAMVAFAVSSSLYAHGMMNGTYPQDGAVVQTPIEHVEVSFGKPMKLINLKVVDSSGNLIAIDFKRSKDAGVLFKTALPILKPGAYRVNWKAMGTDGHMTKGTFDFTQQ